MRRRRADYSRPRRTVSAATYSRRGGTTALHGTPRIQELYEPIGIGRQNRSEDVKPIFRENYAREEGLERKSIGNQQEVLCGTRPL